MRQTDNRVTTTLYLVMLSIWMSAVAKMRTNTHEKSEVPEKFTHVNFEAPRNVIILLLRVGSQICQIERQIQEITHSNRLDQTSDFRER
jgi:hypothetical protein